MFITEPCMASASAGGFTLCRKTGEAPVMLGFLHKHQEVNPYLKTETSKRLETLHPELDYHLEGKDGHLQTNGDSKHYGVAEVFYA